jgi:hypothetical protein
MEYISAYMENNGSVETAKVKGEVIPVTGLASL